MDTVPLDHAKAHLEDLIARAAQGEDVRIDDPRHGLVRIVIESLPKRVRIPGRWQGRINIPEADLLAPLDDKELAWLSGDASS